MVPRIAALFLVLLAARVAVGAAPATPGAARPVQVEAEQSAVLVIGLADLPAGQVDGKGWGEPTKADDRPVRVAGAGQDAWLRVKPWWTGGSRPAEGGHWTIEVLYKDTASHPIVLSAFGNLSKYGDRSELHRFGGLGDAQWKTARIPLGADMIMARPQDGLVEFSIRSVGADVPVASIRVMDLPKGQVEKAAARYNAETRDWIARVQAAKQDRPRNEFSPPQKPAPVVTESKAAVVAYVRSYLQLIYPYSAPQESEINKPIQVTMAQNEYEPAAIGVYANGKDLTNVQILVDPLRNNANREASLNVTVRTAEYALVQNARGHAQRLRGGTVAPRARLPRRRKPRRRPSRRLGHSLRRRPGRLGRREANWRSFRSGSGRCTPRGSQPVRAGCSG